MDTGLAERAIHLARGACVALDGANKPRHLSRVRALYGNRVLPSGAADPFGSTPWALRRTFTLGAGHITAKAKALLDRSRPDRADWT